MEGYNNPDDLSDRLKDAERRISEHPGYKAHAANSALLMTINGVFVPNWHELLPLLEQASSNVGLAFELVQNVHRPDVRDQFQAQMTQRLHNYLASAMTLVDHVRRIMAGRDDSISQEFERRKKDMVANLEVPFMQDLRNFTVHRTLPLLAHRVSMTNLNSPDERFESEVELSVSHLLEWDRWSVATRRFLTDQSEVIVLRPIVRTHGQLVLQLNSWLYDELGRANAQALVEVNRLVVERNAVLAGCDIAAAERFTEQWTQRRTEP